MILLALQEADHCSRLLTLLIEGAYQVTKPRIAFYFEDHCLGVSVGGESPEFKVGTRGIVPWIAQLAGARADLLPIACALLHEVLVISGVRVAAQLCKRESVGLVALHGYPTYRADDQQGISLLLDWDPITHGVKLPIWWETRKEDCSVTVAIPFGEKLLSALADTAMALEPGGTS